MSFSNREPIAKNGVENATTLDAGESTSCATTPEAVEEAIVRYLGKHQSQLKISQFLIKSGMFDLLIKGIIRLKTEAVPEELQAGFFRDHILLGNWTKEQTEELEEEEADLNAEIDALKEERRSLDNEIEEMRHPRPSGPPPGPPGMPRQLIANTLAAPTLMKSHQSAHGQPKVMPVQGAHPKTPPSHAWLFPKRVIYAAWQQYYIWSKNTSSIVGSFLDICNGLCIQSPRPYLDDHVAQFLMHKALSARLTAWLGGARCHSIVIRPTPRNISRKAQLLRARHVARGIPNVVWLCMTDLKKIWRAKYHD